MWNLQSFSAPKCQDHRCCYHGQSCLLFSRLGLWPPGLLSQSLCSQGWPWELIPCGFTHQVPVLKAGTITVALKLNFNSQISTVGPLVSKRVWFLNHPPLHLWWSELAIHPSPPPCMEHLVPSSWWHCLGRLWNIFFRTCTLAGGSVSLQGGLRQLTASPDWLFTHSASCMDKERFCQLSAPATMPRLPWHCRPLHLWSCFCSQYFISAK